MAEPRRFPKYHPHFCLCSKRIPKTAIRYRFGVVMLSMCIEDPEWHDLMMKILGQFPTYNNEEK